MKYFLCACLSFALALALPACGAPYEAPPAQSGTAPAVSEPNPQASSAAISLPKASAPPSVPAKEPEASSSVIESAPLESEIAAGSPALNSQTVSETESEGGKEIMSSKAQEETALQISIHANGNTIVFELGDNQAAKDLYNQLPLSIPVENYSDNEKIFYPSKALDETDAPLHKGGGSGALAYYSPWDNVVIFYGDSNPSGGLYELGHAISGSEHISSMSGTIEVAQVPNQ